LLVTARLRVARETGHQVSRQRAFDPPSRKARSRITLSDWAGQRPTRK